MLDEIEETIPNDESSKKCKTNNRSTWIDKATVKWFTSIIFVALLSPMLAAHIARNAQKRADTRKLYYQSIEAFMPLKQQFWHYLEFCADKTIRSDESKFNAGKQKWLDKINKLLDTYVINSPKISILYYFDQQIFQSEQEFILWFSKIQSTCPIDNGGDLYKKYGVLEGRIFNPMRNFMY